MAVAVGGAAPVIDGAEPGGGAPSEILVFGQHPGVDHVDASTAAVALVAIVTAEGQVCLIDPIQTPRCRLLGQVGRDPPVFFDPLHPGISAESFGVLPSHAGGEANHRVLILVFNDGRVFGRDTFGSAGGGEFVEHHDVLAGDGIDRRDHLALAFVAIRARQQQQPDRGEDLNSHCTERLRRASRIPPLFFRSKRGSERLMIWTVICPPNTCGSPHSHSRC